MHKSVLFLSPETFSQTGGIQKVCRTMAKALNELNLSLNMYDLSDSGNEDTRNYINKDQFRGFSGRKLFFVFNAVLTGIKQKTIILAHINLLPIAYMLKVLSPAKNIILLAHGIEVWNVLSWYQKRFLNKHVVIWAVSKFTKGKLASNGINEDHIKVLPNCLDPYFVKPSTAVKKLDLLIRYNILPQQPILFTLCRLSSFEHKKGYETIINCMPTLLDMLPNLKYIIAGPCDPEERSRLLDLITKLKLQKHVVIPGFIPEDELTDHFILADVFIMTSKKEGFGLVLIEAAACGCKVIAGNMDGSSEALLGGQLGRLVDPESPEQIIDAIRSALDPTSPAASPDMQQLALDTFSFATYKETVNLLLP
jgi:phosphatidylinositol alpha-1,6-mannosyltransferase